MTQLVESITRICRCCADVGRSTSALTFEDWWRCLSGRQESKPCGGKAAAAADLKVDVAMRTGVLWRPRGPARRSGGLEGRHDPPRPGTVKFTARCRSLPQTQLLAGRLDVAETARRGEPRYQLNALIHLCRGLTSSALRLVCQQSEPSRHRWEWDQLHVRKRSKWDPRGVCDHANVAATQDTYLQRPTSYL